MGVLCALGVAQWEPILQYVATSQGRYNVALARKILRA
jgi:hypothetical protein